MEVCSSLLHCDLIIAALLRSIDSEFLSQQTCNSSSKPTMKYHFLLIPVGTTFLKVHFTVPCYPQFCLSIIELSLVWLDDPSDISSGQ